MAPSIPVRMPESAAPPPWPLHPLPACLRHIDLGIVLSVPNCVMPSHQTRKKGQLLTTVMLHSPQLQTPPAHTPVPRPLHLLSYLLPRLFSQMFTPSVPVLVYLVKDLSRPPAPTQPSHPSPPVLYAHHLMPCFSLHVLFVFSQENGLRTGVFSMYGC
jgi:hypothetical protein